MRVLVSTEFYHTKIGGAEQILHSLVQEMSGRDYDVTICSFESSGPCQQCAVQGISHVDFTTYPPTDFSFRATALIPFFQGYDVIFAQHYYHFSSFFAAMVSRYRRTPLVVKSIGRYVSGRDVRNLLYALLESTQGRFSLKSATLVLPTTQFEAKALKRSGVPREKIRVIPSGIRVPCSPSEQDIGSFVEAHKISRGPIVLFVGRLEELKGIDVLLDAMSIVSRKIPDVQCLLAGNEDSRYMSSVLQKRKLGYRLIRTGFLSPQKLATAYEISTVFALPSRSELSSLTLREAQIAKLAVIATNVGGNPEYVTHGQSGILVEPEDPESLAKWLVHLIENEAARRLLAEEGFNSAMKYSLDTYVTKTVDAIAEVARVGQPSR